MSASNIQNAAAAAAARDRGDLPDNNQELDSESDMEYYYEFTAEGDDDQDQGDEEEGQDYEDEDEDMSGRDQDSDEDVMQLVFDAPAGRRLTARQLRLLLAELQRDNTYYGYRDPEFHFLPRFDHPVPAPEGTKLMNSGAFGVTRLRGEERSFEGKRHQALGKKILGRQLGAFTGERARIYNQLIAQDLVPSSKAEFVIHSDHCSYSGQFSRDGNLFYTCTQDFYVRIYDTSNPYKWRFIKSAHYLDGIWTLTDADLSPDSRYIAYSSITNQVYLSTTEDDGEEAQILDFSTGGRRNRHAMGNGGIWSVRFSGDGQELVAGTNERSIYIYDIEQRKSILRLHGHSHDVNAVCYGDENTPHILFSGSDDSTVKVWDRRSMSDGREVGVFPGHTEGITYVDSKGDGRYVLSNGKDQTMKLWDIRSMMSAHDYENLPRKDYSTHFDYRHEQYPAKPHRLPHDKSIVTYTGHPVLRTLIRCHFSPPVSTGSRYVYSGSADGKVAIYNLDATRAGTVDISQTSRIKPGLRGGLTTYTRDVSWHPYAPILAATSWSWERGKGIVSVHAWNGDGKGRRVHVKADNEDDEMDSEDEMEDETRHYTTEMEEDAGLYRRWQGRFRR
ncbi:WD40 repeat-like protein [Ascodesmis nigricans]|uniref:WD40 repeat-like protein n=1 Tax=Ascodesmis nigricans TaxID=341454 RepID=A0A4S2MZ99_9PEZI|nr:WD40 repeat-like protein [Ascodesmis nigricans]